MVQASSAAAAPPEATEVDEATGERRPVLRQPLVAGDGNDYRRTHRQCTRHNPTRAMVAAHNMKYMPREADKPVALQHWRRMLPRGPKGTAFVSASASTSEAPPQRMQQDLERQREALAQRLAPPEQVLDHAAAKRATARRTQHIAALNYEAKPLTAYEGRIDMELFKQPHDENGGHAPWRTVVNTRLQERLPAPLPANTQPAGGWGMDADLHAGGVPLVQRLSTGFVEPAPAASTDPRPAMWRTLTMGIAAEMQAAARGVLTDASISDADRRRFHQQGPGPAAADGDAATSQYRRSLAQVAVPIAGVLPAAAAARAALAPGELAAEGAAVAAAAHAAVPADELLSATMASLRHAANDGDGGQEHYTHELRRTAVDVARQVAELLDRNPQVMARLLPGLMGASSGEHDGGVTPSRPMAPAAGPGIQEALHQLCKRLQAEDRDIHGITQAAPAPGQRALVAGVDVDPRAPAPRPPPAAADGADAVRVPAPVRGLSQLLPAALAAQYRLALQSGQEAGQEGEAPWMRRAGLHATADLDAAALRLGRGQGQAVTAARTLAAQGLRDRGGIVSLATAAAVRESSLDLTHAVLRAMARAGSVTRSPHALAARAAGDHCEGTAPRPRAPELALDHEAEVASGRTRSAAALADEGVQDGADAAAGHRARATLAWDAAMPAARTLAAAGGAVTSARELATAGAASEDHAAALARSAIMAAREPEGAEAEATRAMAQAGGGTATPSALAHWGVAAADSSSHDPRFRVAATAHDGSASNTATRTWTAAGGAVRSTAGLAADGVTENDSGGHVADAVARAMAMVEASADLTHVAARKWAAAAAVTRPGARLGDEGFALAASVPARLDASQAPRDAHADMATPAARAMAGLKAMGLPVPREEDELRQQRMKPGAAVIDAEVAQDTAVQRDAQATGRARSGRQGTDLGLAPAAGTHETDYDLALAQAVAAAMQAVRGDTLQRGGAGDDGAWQRGRVAPLFHKGVVLDTHDLAASRAAGVGHHSRSTVADGHAPMAAARFGRAAEVEDAVLLRSIQRLGAQVLASLDLVAPGDRAAAQALGSRLADMDQDCMARGVLNNVLGLAVLESAMAPRYAQGLALDATEQLPEEARLRAQRLYSVLLQGNVREGAVHAQRRLEGDDYLTHMQQDGRHHAERDGTVGSAVEVRGTSRLQEGADHANLRWRPSRLPGQGSLASDHGELRRTLLPRARAAVVERPVSVQA